MQNSVGEESHLAIETSGHGALKENNWLDDGAYLMVSTLLTHHCFQLYAAEFIQNVEWRFVNSIIIILFIYFLSQVKILNKLASTRASGQSHGSKVLTELVDGLEEPGVAIELRLKIDQNNPDLKGGWVG